MVLQGGDAGSAIDGSRWQGIGHGGFAGQLVMAMARSTSSEVKGREDGNRAWFGEALAAIGSPRDDWLLRVEVIDGGGDVGRGCG